MSKRTDFEEMHRLHREREEKRSGKVSAERVEASDSDEDFEIPEFKFKEEPVQLNTDMSNVVIVDNLPVVPESKYDKLVAVLEKIFKKYEIRLPKDNFLMPFDESKKTKGFAFVEFANNDEAKAALEKLDGHKLDQQHILKLNLLTDFEQYEKIPDQLPEYTPKPFEQKENLRWWLLDQKCRDQYAIRFVDEVELYWHDALRDPELAYKRSNWTEYLIKWSPYGTYLATFHSRGIALWGGPNWDPIGRFQHQGVKLIDFSPRESYLITWSDGQGRDVPPQLTIWDVRTVKKLKTFTNEGPSGQTGWPAFRWSHDEKYFAKIVLDEKDESKNAIHIYETATMTLLDKKPAVIPGVRDFAWSPTDNIIAYWVAESGNKPARVALEDIPSRNIVGQKNFFSVTNVNLHWHPQGNFLCAKVDRVPKTKNAKLTNFELFRMREKNVPVEAIEITDTVIAFAWEPNGIRFAIIHGELPKPNVSFYTMGAVQKGTVKLINTLEKKTANHLFWSPRGNYIVLAGLRTMNGVLEFWDVNEMELLGTGSHFMATDVEWDPSGRYLATSVSYYRYQHENGYIIWNMLGQQLEKKAVEKFWQFLWRPRPPSLLTKADHEWINKNFKKLSEQYEKEVKDIILFQTNAELAEKKRLLDEFNAYREEKIKEFKAIKEALKALRHGEDIDDEKDVIKREEVIEEVLEYKEQIID